MKHCLLGILAIQVAQFVSAAPGRFLWQIGKPDHDNAEFALAPSHYRQFDQDPVFIVGESDSRRDWPYVQPGPGDAWAGNRPHTFEILFGLKIAPGPGQCRLQFGLLDTHSQGPPALRIEVNGHSFERELPNGAGDDSLLGQPAKGKPYQFDIEFPAGLLQIGDNQVRITTVSGSWLLYDWLGLETPPSAELAAVTGRTRIERVQPIPALRARDDLLFQPVRVTLRHMGSTTNGTLRLEGGDALPIRLERGAQTIETLVAAVTTETQRQLAVEAGGQVVAQQSVTLKPVPKLTIYLLPHSHTDIGYTEIQTAVEKKQVNNLLEGIASARGTADYPEGARFVWNVEVLWAADLYLHRLNDQQRGAFFDAVKKGQVALNGMYLNELTGLCRPEELLRLFKYATQLGQQTGVPIDSAMISDVPGYTWGTVTAMAQAGIKYFSVAPNWFDRIGTILRDWVNRPFYWVGPDGHSKVLVWIPFSGYALSHRYKQLSAELVGDLCADLEQKQYPYDIVYLRWSGHGDNAAPDPAICDFVKAWNATNAWPRFIISGTSEAFRALEWRYADRIPRVRGDWTPYWEDGAGSSALETAMNRANSERLTQAEAAWAMLNPQAYPAQSFDAAWRNVLLYSEHTWGASGSVWDPESQKTKEQWEIKRSCAVQADTESRRLLAEAFIGKQGPGLPRRSAAEADSQIDVFNTTSWPRTELAILSREISTAGDRVVDDQGKPVVSQRLSDGKLVFKASVVPPFAARRYTLSGGAAYTVGEASAHGTVVDNGLLRVQVDDQGGGIVELSAKGIEANLADTGSGQAINDYLFLAGNNLANLKRNGPVKITVKERGPLVASLLIESDAPGCRRLTRELRMIAGLDYVELINTVDKERAPITPKPGDHAFAQSGGKESVNFAFPFNVPDGALRLNIPLGEMQPETEQLAGSCKNWFTVGQWADIANDDFGVTWVTLDAPLIEVGGITATLLGSQRDPDVWRKRVERTQRFYSWVMNNHWGTNYRAYQEGPVVFRYYLRPHLKFSPDAAARFADGLSQPLVVRPAAGASPSAGSRLSVSPADVLVTAYKPSDDGHAWIVRLFGAGGKDAEARLTWADPQPAQLWLSDTSERPLRKLEGSIPVPAWGLVTLRAERPN